MLGDGFNPYRVFSSAETHCLGPDTYQCECVSIPIGFSHQLRLPIRYFRYRYSRVSIPIGFSHQLRLRSPRVPGLVPLVSIPIGFSHQLRLERHRVSAGIYTVSIPIGFSHQLRHVTEVAGSIIDMFQSLSGFLIS